MGKIDITYDRPAELAFFAVVGATTAKDIADKIVEYYSGEPTRLILWDFTQADLRSFSSEDIRRIVELTQRYSARRPGGKSALLFSSDFGFGLGRMFDIQEDLVKSPVTYMSFRDRAEALQWLKSD